VSNALAIAGVTAVLRDMIDTTMIDQNVSAAMGQGVTVTAVAPDTIALEGTDARPQVNVFLHQVTPNAAWRNVGLPSRGRNGDRLSNPPLALDLHYLVTAYGIDDLGPRCCSASRCCRCTRCLCSRATPSERR